MTPGEFKEIAAAMREFGISRAKMGDVEIELGGNIGNGAVTAPPPAAVPAQAMVPPDAPAPESEPIKHKVEQLVSLMKLNDADLVDTLFPDHTDLEAESA